MEPIIVYRSLDPCSPSPFPQTKDKSVKRAVLGRPTRKTFTFEKGMVTITLAFPLSLLVFYSLWFLSLSFFPCPIQQFKGKQLMFIYIIFVVSPRSVKMAWKHLLTGLLVHHQIRWSASGAGPPLLISGHGETRRFTAATRVGCLWRSCVLLSRSCMRRPDHSFMFVIDQFSFLCSAASFLLKIHSNLAKWLK